MVECDLDKPGTIEIMRLEVVAGPSAEKSRPGLSGRWPTIPGRKRATPLIRSCPVAPGPDTGYSDSTGWRKVAHVRSLIFSWRQAGSLQV